MPPPVCAPITLASVLPPRQKLRPNTGWQRRPSRRQPKTRSLLLPLARPQISGRNRSALSPPPNPRRLRPQLRGRTSSQAGQSDHGRHHFCRSSLGRHFALPQEEQGIFGHFVHHLLPCISFPSVPSKEGDCRQEESQHSIASSFHPSKLSGIGLLRQLPF
jgi:hypothetical protein